MVGERVRHMWPRVSQPRLMVTDAALEFRSLYIACSAAYVSSPSIRGMLGFLKLSTSLSTEGAALAGGE